MSAMSNLAIQHDEARQVSGIDLVECERDHYKARVFTLEARLKAVIGALTIGRDSALADGGSDMPFCRGLSAGYGNALTAVQDALKD